MCLMLWAYNETCKGVVTSVPCGNWEGVGPHFGRGTHQWMWVRFYNSWVFSNESRVGMELRIKKLVRKFNWLI